MEMAVGVPSGSDVDYDLQYPSKPCQNNVFSSSKFPVRSDALKKRKRDEQSHTRLIQRCTLWSCSLDP